MKTRGYSLAELMIGLAMMAVFIGIAVPSYRDQAARTRDKALKQNLYVVRRALQQAYADTGGHPVSLNDLARGVAPLTINYKTVGVQSITDPLMWRGPYLPSVPNDPVSNAPLNYSFSSVTGLASVSSSAAGADRGGTPYSSY